MVCALDLIMFPQNSYLENIVPNGSIFGSSVYKEVIKVKGGNEGILLIS